MKPFVKHVGGKRLLVPQLMEHIPAELLANGFAYHEPFVGGGALLFALLGLDNAAFKNGKNLIQGATVCDANERLVRTYAGLKANVEGVLDRLEQMENTPDFFYAMRELSVWRPALGDLPAGAEIDSKSDSAVAAWYLYLLKTCYGGIFRVNSKNEFNVKFGNFAKPRFDIESIRACAAALQRVTIRKGDFSYVLDTPQRGGAAAGDVVYFDPPYISLTDVKTGDGKSFGAYNAEPFSYDDQVRLRDAARVLKDQEVHVIVSNSDTPLTRELYADFEIHEVVARRTIGNPTGGAGSAKELIIT